MPPTRGARLAACTLCAVLLACACGGSPAPSPTARGDGTRELRQPIPGVVLSIPELWSVRPSDSPDALLVSNLPAPSEADPSESTEATFEVRRLPREGATDLNAWTSALAEELDDVISRETITLSGRPAVRFRVSGVGGDWAFVYAMSGGEVLAISYGPLAGAQDTVYQQILNSLTLDP